MSDCRLYLVSPPKLSAANFLIPLKEALDGGDVASFQLRLKHVSDDEIRQGIKLLAQTTGIFTETAGGVTTAVLAKLAERGDIDPEERIVLYITGEGLKTLDTARGTFEAWEIEPNVEAFDQAAAVGALA